MKKTMLLLSACCAFISGVSQASQDITHDIAIYGKLENVKSGCTVLMSKYVIDLHRDIRAMPTQGKLSTQPDDIFYIQLGGDNCDANEGYKNIGLRFLGSADNVEGTVLANTDTSESAATGIGVQMSDLYHDFITPNTDIVKFPAAMFGDGSPTTHAASLTLNLNLVKLKNQEAVAGSVKTNLTVQIERL